MSWDLSEYEEVRERIPRFLEQYPDGRIISDPPVFGKDGGGVWMQARLYKNAEEQAAGLPLSVGTAMEWHTSSGVNATSFLENCETSAIGRALANIGIHGKQRPSREEMQKVERLTPVPEDPGSYLLPMGKHKGEPIAAVPTGYLEWLLTSNAHADTKAAVAAYLGLLPPAAGHKHDADGNPMEPDGSEGDGIPF